MNLMFNYRKLAKLAVNYAVYIKPGEKVLIRGPELAADLIRAVYVEVLKAGGHPLIRIDLTGIQELFFKHASDNQIEFLPPPRKLIVDTYDAFINISADYNTHKLELVNPKKLKKRQISELEKRIADQSKRIKNADKARDKRLKEIEKEKQASLS